MPKPRLGFKNLKPVCRVGVLPLQTVAASNENYDARLGCASDNMFRLYDPYLGRFLSADTIIPDALDMQQFNRYSYVTNNPLKFVDPTGHDGRGFWGGRGFMETITVTGSSVGGISVGIGAFTDGSGIGSVGSSGIGGSTTTTSEASGTGSEGEDDSFCIGSDAVCQSPNVDEMLNDAFICNVACDRGDTQTLEDAAAIGINCGCDNSTNVASSNGSSRPNTSRSISSAVGSLSGIGTPIEAGGRNSAASPSTPVGGTGTLLDMLIPEASAQSSSSGQSASRSVFDNFGRHLPTPPSSVLDFGVGLGNGVSLGIGGYLSELINGENSFDRGSSAFLVGQVTSIITPGLGQAAALRFAAALGGTKVFRILNRGRFLRIGPGRMPANGSFPAGPKIPRLSLGRGPGNPHVDLRVRLVD